MVIWVMCFLVRQKLEINVVFHQVIYPTRFLEGEDAANNFLFNADRYVYYRQLSDVNGILIRTQAHAFTHI